MTTIGPLAFGAPWVLFGLIALPVIWWLLRVTPPAAKRVRFPAVRLLLGIPQSEETPAHTPLWLLLLRLAIAALAIFALSDPYLNPQAAGLKSSAVVVVVDNGWASAARWDDRVGAMQSLATEAGTSRSARSCSSLSRAWSWSWPACGSCASWARAGVASRAAPVSSRRFMPRRDEVSLDRVSRDA